MIINNLGDTVLNLYEVIIVTENICCRATHWLGEGHFISLQIKFRTEHLRLETLLRIY